MWEKCKWNTLHDKNIHGVVGGNVCQMWFLIVQNWRTAVENGYIQTMQALYALMHFVICYKGWNIGKEYSSLPCLLLRQSQQITSNFNVYIWLHTSQTSAWLWYCEGCNAAAASITENQQIKFMWIYKFINPSTGISNACLLKELGKVNH